MILDDDVVAKREFVMRAPERITQPSPMTDFPSIETSG